MRIPSYNGDFEEPWYWEYYGKDLFEYSFYSSRYINLKNKSDLIEANRYKSLVPSNVLDKFLWRRERNFNITYTLFHFQQKYHSMFDSLYLTLDDTGTYGFNVDEALKLKELKASLKLNDDIVRIYPGADEVESCLLSKMIVQDSLKKHQEFFINFLVKIILLILFNILIFRDVIFNITKFTIDLTRIS